MIYAANFKCNHTRKSYEIYAKELDCIIKNHKISDEIIVFPNSASFLNGNFSFIQGAQNFYPCKNGAFTGEIGQEILDEFHINTVLIGHCERRNLGESDEFIKEKFEFGVLNEYKIILCIGENLDIKMRGKTREFLASQLDLIDLNYKNLILAYEPIWAIGTGKSAKIEDISEILSFLATLFNGKILYGGSVNSKNIAQIKQIKHCSGVLVGSASLEIKTFCELFL